MKTLENRITRRNLPLNDMYTIIDSYYAGSDNGTCCDNCNKYITNIAVIQNKDNQKYNVGLDCAETLRNLNGLDDIIKDFKESKAIRAKINKALKDNKEIKTTYTIYGKLNITANNLNICLIDKTFAQKFLPDYYAKTSNSEKLNYTPFDADLIPLGTKKENLPLTIKHENITIDISYGDFKPFDLYGKTVINKGYRIDTNINGIQLEQQTTYMPNDLNYKLQYIINRHLFDLF